MDRDLQTATRKNTLSVFRPGWLNCSSPVIDVYQHHLKHWYPSSNEHTARVAENSFRAFMAYLKAKKLTDLPLSELQSDVSRSYARYLDRKYPHKATYTLYLTGYRTFVRTLRKHVPELQTDADEIKGPPPKALEFKGLDSLQVADLRAVATEARTRFLIELILNTGLRRSEVLSLTIGQLAPDRTYFKNVHGKGNRYDDVYINKYLREELDSYLVWWGETVIREDKKFSKMSLVEQGGYPLLLSNWCAKSGSPQLWRMSESSLSRLVRCACLQTHIIPLSLAHPHTLRHTYAYSLLGVGVPIEIVSKLMRHNSIQTTMIYSQRRKEELEDASERIGNGNGHLHQV